MTRIRPVNLNVDEGCQSYFSLGMPVALTTTNLMDVWQVVS